MADSDLFGTAVPVAPSVGSPSAALEGALERLRDLRRSPYPEDGEDAGAPVAQLVQDAERMAYDLVEEAARFREQVLAEVEELRLHAEREGASVLDQARATANRLHAEGERDRANLLDRARVEVDQLHRQAEAKRAALVRAARQHADNVATEAQNDRAALLQGARAEAGRLRVEGQDERAALLDAAHAQAERIRQEATEEATALLARCRAEAEEAQAEAHPATTSTGSTRPAITPMHSSEISARQFPRGWRGLDPEPVQKWLALVEASQATLEDEVDRLQVAWDDAVDCLARLKIRLATLQAGQGNPRSDLELEHAREEWQQAARALAASTRDRPARSTFESLLVRQAMMEAPIRRRLFGYARAEVDRLLASSAAQVARLENRASILATENQQLRQRLLAQASWRLPVPAGDAPAERDSMRSLSPAPGPATTGSGDQG
jgi:cell division septum initiation protein DivIVA